MTELPARIQRKLNVTAQGCWEWTGYRNPHGYGKVRFKGRAVGAHRAVYELLVGEIPTGLHLHHTCANPPCCNPAHLEPIDPSTHARTDGGAVVQSSKTHCVHGHSLEDAYIYNGWRKCRTCTLAFQRKLHAEGRTTYHRRKAAPR